MQKHFRVNFDPYLSFYFTQPPRCMGVLKQSVTELCDTFDYCLVSQPFRKSDNQKRADGNQSEFRVLRPCDDNWRFFPIEFLCASSYATIKRINIIVVYFHQDLRHRTARKSFRNYFMNKKFLSETFALSSDSAVV